MRKNREKSIMGVTSTLTLQRYSIKENRIYYWVHFTDYFLFQFILTLHLRGYRLNPTADMHLSTGPLSVYAGRVVSGLFNLFWRSVIDLLRWNFCSFRACAKVFLHVLKIYWWSLEVFKDYTMVHLFRFIIYMYLFYSIIKTIWLAVHI